MFGPIGVVMKRRAPLFVMLGAAVLLASCARQPPPLMPNAPGFWAGLLHGFLIFFSLIGSIFGDYRIYAFPNSGGWYDFGYFLGAAAFLSGSSRSWP